MNSEDWKLEEYKALRAEIVQSISKQHHILLSGYAFSATLTGLLIGVPDARVAFLLIPYAFISMAALWAVECNRMVRASYYLAYYSWPGMGWESWIRRTKGDERRFGRLQHWLQMLVVVGIPFLASIFCGFVAAVALRIHEKNLPLNADTIECVFWCSVLVLWAVNIYFIWQVSDLARLRKDEPKLDDGSASKIQQ